MADINRMSGDDYPLTETLTENGEAADLTNASSVTLRIRETDEDGPLLLEGTGSVVDEDAGTVRYEFADGALDTTGFFVVQWEVTYADGTKSKFPDAEYLYMRVGQGLQA